MSAKKITTIEELGDVLQDFRSETKATFKSIGDQLVRMETDMEALLELRKLDAKIEKIRENIREKLHVEV